ncbi:hypothetical protein LTR56_015432 [Elasticomyces elasticus]|nr:hypothetical protein LTR56_015432 [Elasticomyces elasticus]KAK4912687.1 hypothetical protein LTR49_018860 [Elasticomyces elasticus]KAK5761803.1 hypothetical protein LTS12_008058 [Elasticomyces elasticus]
MAPRAIAQHSVRLADWTAEIAIYEPGPDSVAFIEARITTSQLSLPMPPQLAVLLTDAMHVMVYEETHEVPLCGVFCCTAAGETNRLRENQSGTYLKGPQLLFLPCIMSEQWHTAWRNADMPSKIQMVSTYWKDFPSEARALPVYLLSTEWPRHSPNAKETLRATMFPGNASVEQLAAIPNGVLIELIAHRFLTMPMYDIRPYLRLNTAMHLRGDDQVRALVEAVGSYALKHPDQLIRYGVARGLADQATTRDAAEDSDSDSSPSDDDAAHGKAAGEVEAKKGKGKGKGKQGTKKSNGGKERKKAGKTGGKKAATKASTKAATKKSKGGKKTAKKSTRTKNGESSDNGNVDGMLGFASPDGRHVPAKRAFRTITGQSRVKAGVRNSTRDHKKASNEEDASSRATKSSGVEEVDEEGWGVTDEEDVSMSEEELLNDPDGSYGDQ